MKSPSIVAVCLCAALNASAVSTSMYVQDGLVACWDGIENAGAGTHDAGATVWKDIVRGYEFSLTNVTVDADSMTFAGTSSSYGTLSAADTTSTFVTAKNGTMEIVYASRTGTGNQVLLQSSSDSGIAFGILGGSFILPYTNGSTTRRKKFTLTSGTSTNSVAVCYTGGEPSSAITNGVALTSPGTDSWGSPDALTYIGVRATKAANTHFPGSIYCIRLYDRQLTDAEIAVNQSVDKLRFMLDADNALLVTGAPDLLGSPSPAYGGIVGLSPGNTREVSCGAAVVTNAAGNAEYRCAGWKLYNGAGAVVDSGAGTSFTYTHPTPAAFRRLEWQWEVSQRFTDFSDYVLDGLVACWDGIGNAGIGVHLDNATVWKSLVGGYEFALSNVTASAKGMTFAGTAGSDDKANSYGVLSAADTASTFAAAADATLEIVFRSSSSAASQVLLQPASSACTAFGFYNTSTLVAYSAASGMKRGFAASAGTAVNSFSVRYANSEPSSAIANGSTVQYSGTSAWGSPGTETFIGARASRDKDYVFAGDIYCIRLYNRQLTDEEIAANHRIDALRFKTDAVAESTLAISGTIDGVGAPSPAYGYLCELSAGDNRAVSCGKVPWKGSDDTKYSCSGWKLYDENGAVVDSGSGTSFTYTHPTPAAYRRLEWQWKEGAGVGLLIFVR